MRGAAGAAQGCSGVASRRRRSRELVAAAPRPGSKSPLFSSPDLPKARAGPRMSRGGVPQHPVLSPPRLCSVSLSGSRFSTSAPWAPPEWEGAAVPPPRPFPSRPTAAARPDAGLSARGQTTPPTDGRVSRLPDAGIPRVGGGLRRAQGRGRRRRKGRRQIATISA